MLKISMAIALITASAASYGFAATKEKSSNRQLSSASGKISCTTGFKTKAGEIQTSNVDIAIGASDFSMPLVRDVVSADGRYEFHVAAGGTGDSGPYYFDHVEITDKVTGYRSKFLASPSDKGTRHMNLMLINDKVNELATLDCKIEGAE
jgi:hypothetical protein